MNNKYTKKWGIIAFGLLMFGVIHVSGQAMPDPIPVTIVLDKAGYYQHGNNKNNTTIGTPDPSGRETRDSVMVSSKMKYFVAPDKFYNKTYYDQNVYTNTSITTSNFVWTIPSAIGTLNAYENKNTTNTSPYVTIEWTAEGQGDITIVEKPVITGLSVTCDGEPNTIPVTVIPKPNVMFGLKDGTRTAAECATFDPNEADGSGNEYPIFDFPLIPASTATGAVISKANKVVITYSITKDDGTEGGDQTVTLASANAATGQLSLKFNDFGKYVVTIKSITDRIATKCGITTANVSTTTTDNQFTYYVLPQPKAGKTYHVPNNF